MDKFISKAGSQASGRPALFIGTIKKHRLRFVFPLDISALSAETFTLFSLCDIHPFRRTVICAKCGNGARNVLKIKKRKHFRNPKRLHESRMILQLRTVLSQAHGTYSERM
jgi:hypothetical protein